MKSLLVLFFTLITLSHFRSNAQNSISIEVDLNTLICAFLNPYEQDLCSRDLYYENDPSAVRFCEGFYNETLGTRCFQSLIGSFFSRNTLNSCDQLYSDNQKLECLNVIRNGYFDSGAVKVCDSLYSGQINCLLTIKDRTYARHETVACQSRYSTQATTDCLKALGRPLNWQERYNGNPNGYRRNQEPNVIDIITDILTGGSPSNYNNIETCQVYNSSSYLDSVPRDGFLYYASHFAKEHNSCVVSSFFNETKSRYLYSENGNLIASRLTESEASDLKRQNGYTRCSILICK